MSRGRHIAERWRDIAAYAVIATAVFLLLRAQFPDEWVDRVLPFLWLESSSSAAAFALSWPDWVYYAIPTKAPTIFAWGVVSTILVSVLIAFKGRWRGRLGFRFALVYPPLYTSVVLATALLVGVSTVVKGLPSFINALDTLKWVAFSTSPVVIAVSLYLGTLAFMRYRNDSEYESTSDADKDESPAGLPATVKELLEWIRTDEPIGTSEQPTHS